MSTWIVKNIVPTNHYLDSLAHILESLYCAASQLSMIEFTSGDKDYVVLKKSDFIEWFGWDSEREKKKPT